MTHEPANVGAEKNPSYMPEIIAHAMVEVCLASFPLTLIGLNTLRSIKDKRVEIRNQKQIEILLSELSDKIRQLEQEQKLDKETLKQNLIYQEVAQKRLLLVSALDTPKELNLSAKLIALCSLLTGDDPKDIHLLRAIGEITVEEFRVFHLAKVLRLELEKRVSQFTDLERKDAQIKRDLEREMDREFFVEGEKLLKLYDFSHLTTRLHTYGLIQAARIDGWTTYDDLDPKTPIPEFTPIGEYFWNQLKKA